MIDQKCANPAAELANGVRIPEQVAATLGLQATSSIKAFQVLSVAAPRRRFRTFAAGWVVVRRSDGLRRSVPIYRRRAVLVSGSGVRQ